MATPTGSPVRTSSSYYQPPPAPNRRNDNTANEMEELINGLHKNKNEIIVEFQQKLINGKTVLLSRENQNPATRVYIDTDEVSPRYVYKISYNSIIDREIKAYKALEKKDPERKHILERVGEPIQLSNKFGMFVTKHKDGLIPENLIYWNLTQAENNNDDDEIKRLGMLINDAKIYLDKAGVTHNDIAGNLYYAYGTFVWIDFEVSDVKGKKSLLSSISPFSSPKKKSQVLFGYSDDEESPFKRPKGLSSDENYDINKSLFDDEFKGGKYHNKKLRKTNKRRIRKLKSRKLRSRKLKSRK